MHQKPPCCPATCTRNLPAVLQLHCADTLTGFPRQTPHVQQIPSSLDDHPRLAHRATGGVSLHLHYRHARLSQAVARRLCARPLRTRQAASCPVRIGVRCYSYHRDASPHHEDGDPASARSAFKRCIWKKYFRLADVIAAEHHLVATMFNPDDRSCWGYKDIQVGRYPSRHAILS